MKNLQFLLYSLFFSLVFTVHAGQVAKQDDFYVPIEQLKGLPLTSPPTKDSEEWKNDSAVMVDWQGKRSQEDCIRTDSSFFVTFSSIWGKKSPFPELLPTEVQTFFEKLDSEICVIVKLLKNRYKRSRPDNPYPCLWTDSRMNKKKKGYSYPSGHAAISRVFANVLTDIVPERKAEFFAKADEIARDRIVIGVHYPSDIAAGKQLGDLFHTELLKSEAYRNDLLKIKAFLVK